MKLKYSLLWPNCYEYFLVKTNKTFTLSDYYSSVDKKLTHSMKDSDFKFPLSVVKPAIREICYLMHSLKIAVFFKFASSARK